MPNLFERSKEVAPKATAVKKSKAVEVTIAGMSRVAALDFLIKELTTLKKTEEIAVKGLVKDEFVEVGCKLERRPENFRGVDGAGSASCELRSRSSASALSKEEQALFLEYELPMAEVDLVEECYRFNPKYSEDSDLLAKVSRAMERVKDIPDDLIELQKGSKQIIAGEGALDALYKQHKAPTVRTLLERVGVLVLKPKFDGTTDEAYNVAKPLLSQQQKIEAGETVETQTPPARGARKRAA